MAIERDAFPPFSNSRFYQRLSLAGSRQGLGVYVFSPNRVDWTGSRVSGYVYNPNTGAWEKCRLPLPDLVYDRFFYSRSSQYRAARPHIRRLRGMRRVRFLGIGLPGKLRVHQLLKEDALVRPHLAGLKPVASLRDLAAMLATHGDLVLKPQGGCQGKGVFRLTAIGHEPPRYAARGRDGRNRVFAREFDNGKELADWLKARLKRNPHTAEPYLDLTTAGGEPFDIRALVQKNRKGRWQWIGMVARVGQPGGLTSNLHGGGRAVKASDLLSRQFGDRAGELAGTIRSLSLRIARTLESRYGRLVEIGADFGIDRSGAVWLLEVNSRPGRTVFAKTGDRKASLRATLNPIHYACYLRDRQLGG